jgi:hypothetical protein
MGVMTAGLESNLLDIERASERVAAELILPIRGELVGPESAFELRRQELRKEMTPIVEAAKAVTVIDTAEQAEEAAKLGRLLQVGMKEGELFFKGVKVRIDLVKKPVLAAEKEDMDRLEAEKGKLGRLITLYGAKVKGEQEEADRKAREEAPRKAQEEQLARAIELEAAGELDAAEAILEEQPYVMPVVTQSQGPVKLAGTVGKVWPSRKGSVCRVAGWRRKRRATSVVDA